MKIKYMLVNKTGKARKIPPFEAWQWTHHVEDESQLQSLFNGLKKTIRDNRLTLANLYVEPPAANKAYAAAPSFAYKGPIIYDETLWPKRIINRHEEAPDDRFFDACFDSAANDCTVTSPWGAMLKGAKL